VVEMDSLFELKLRVFSAIHRLIELVPDKERTVENLLGVLLQAVPQLAAVVTNGGSPEVRFFFGPSLDSEKQQRIRSLYKSEFDAVCRMPRPFVVLPDNPKPMFIDRKTLYCIQREQMCLLGLPIVMGGEVTGALIVDRFFRDQVSLVENVRLLSMLASFLAQAFSFKSRAGSPERAFAEEDRNSGPNMPEERIDLVCLGKSAAGRKLGAAVRKVAPTGAPVLITGEQGTGRRSIARFIHELSGRAPYPFERVHCSLPEDLLKRELFGSEDGFLSGDIDLYAPSAFQRAAGGTLALIDIGDLSAALQVELLDFLERVQTGFFGAASLGRTDVRLIAVSSVDLFEAARKGVFMRDLLNRLGALAVNVPSLRERKEDVPFFIRHFFDLACRELGRKTQLSSQAFKKLCEYDWPGNLEEIRNSVFRLAAMAEGAEVEAEDFTPALEQKAQAGFGAEDLENAASWSRLDEIERNELSAALARNRWIRRKAANDLGLTFRQMNYRVKKFGLDELIKEHRLAGRSR
jgi:Nif-specific regulatory protein